MAEPRGEPRAEVAFEVHYQTAQEFLSAYSRNISGGGIFIRTQQPPPLNQKVQLRFTMPGIAHPFECEGIVVWSSPVPSRGVLPSGMGIKFLDLDPESRQLIVEFVKTHGPAARSERKG